jgi:peptidoglycan hydrolase FlgJ
VAINVATDIVSDVLSAGNPDTTRVATERLMRLPSAAGADFEAEAAAMQGIGGAGVTSLRPRGLLPPSDKPTVVRPEGGDAAGTTYRKFEAFVLQTFMESVLPRNDHLFGKGTAGNMWRSMLAEQLGTQLAKSGGVGIARMLAKARSTDAEPAVDGTH